jgi:hypothetical protein
MLKNQECGNKELVCPRQIDRKTCGGCEWKMRIIKRGVKCQKGKQSIVKSVPIWDNRK